MPDFRTDDDDRPRRRDDRDRDRDRGGDRYGESRPAPPPGLSILGLLALIGGVISLLVSFVPCIGIIAIGGGVIGIVVGVVALLIAPGSNHGRGLPTAAIIVNVLSIVVAGAWILILGAIANRVPPPADVDTADAVAVSAAQLCRDYDTNVLKADDTYKGKVLEVTGQVKLVSRERVGRVTVEVGSGTDTVDCDFGAAGQADLAGVEVGQTVTVRGRCKGVDRRSKFVILESCKMVKNVPADGPAAAATADAVNLIAEYDADAAKGDRLYKGKVVEVTGEVSETFDENRKERVVQFHVEGKLTYLEFRLTPEATKAAGPIRAGRVMTLRGRCAGLQGDDRYVLFENATVVR